MSVKTAGARQLLPVAKTLQARNPEAMQLSMEKQLNVPHYIKQLNSKVLRTRVEPQSRVRGWGPRCALIQNQVARSKSVCFPMCAKQKH